ncbi:MAG: TetR/AcrR family transcriptional regulator [Candidatus Binatia bacterium]
MSRTRELVEEEILRVAAACFSQRGYQATTLEDIASQVGISRVTFYTYFKNKEAVLKKVLDRMFRTYQQGLETIFTASLPRQEKLRRAVAHHIACLTTDEAARFFLSEEKNLPLQITRHLQQTKQKIEQLIEREIASGIERGEIIAVNPRLLTHAFLGMCNWLYRWYLPGDPIPPEEIVETFTRIFESGSVLARAESNGLPAGGQLHRLEKEVGEIKRELKKVSHALQLTARS